MPLPESEKVPDIQPAFVALIVFGEDVFEVLGLEPSFIVVCHGVAAMFVFVDSVDVDAEEGVRQESVEGRVRQGGMDDDGYKGRERGRPAPFAAANVGVLRPDDAVVICIPVLNVLLDNLIQP